MTEDPDRGGPACEDETHEQNGDEKFLSRWSKRKQAVQRKVTTAKTTAAMETPVPEEPIPLNTVTASDTTGRMLTTVEADRFALNGDEENQEPEVLTDEDMPAVEELDEDSDYSGFMSPGVSDGLRKIALRKLFAGAGFNIRDGLDDYDDDFTDFPALGDIVTCDMKHQMELAEERKRKAEQLEEEEHLDLSEHGEEAAVQEVEGLNDDTGQNDLAYDNSEQVDLDHDDSEQNNLKKGESISDCESNVISEDSGDRDLSIDDQPVQGDQTLKQVKFRVAPEDDS